MNGTALSAGAYTTQTSYVLASGASIRFNYLVSGNRICVIQVDVMVEKDQIF